MRYQTAPRPVRPPGYRDDSPAAIAAKRATGIAQKEGKPPPGEQMFPGDKRKSRARTARQHYVEARTNFMNLAVAYASVHLPSREVDEASLRDGFRIVLTISPRRRAD